MNILQEVGGLLSFDMTGAIHSCTIIFISKLFLSLKLPTHNSGISRGTGWPWRSTQRSERRITFKAPGYDPLNTKWWTFLLLLRWMNSWWNWLLLDWPADTQSKIFNTFQMYLYLFILPRACCLEAPDVEHVREWGKLTGEIKMK